MRRSAQPSLDSVLAELSTIKSHIAAYADNSATEAVSSIEATAADVGASVCNAVRSNAFACILGAFVLGLAAAGWRRLT